MIAILRSVQLLAAALLVGGPAFLLLVWQPARLRADHLTPPDAADQRLRRRVQVITWCAAVALIAGALGDLWRMAQDISQGAGDASALNASALTATVLGLVTGTSVGRLIGLRVLLVLALLLTRPWRAGGRVQRALVPVVGIAVLATISLSGHAAAGLGNHWLSVPADLVHLLGTSIWYGGLCTLAVLPWRSLQQEENLPAVVDRFSDLALLVVGLLTATGLYMAGLRLYGVRALVEHPYGQTLAIKLAFFAGVIALAAVNHLYVRRRLGLAERRQKAQRWLRLLIAGEVVLGLAVMIMAGVLSTDAPPQGEPVRISISVDDAKILPAAVTIPLNRPVLLTVRNGGTAPHSYVIVQMPYELVASGHQHGTAALLMVHVDHPGERQTVQFIPRQRGTYQVYDMDVNDNVPMLTGTLTVK